MFKKILAAAALCFVTSSWAAVDVNKASEAELDGIKGLGPATSTRILDARKKGEFKDWNDLIERVKGVNTRKATQLSEAGLTVNGAAFAVKDVSAAPKDPKKPAAPKDAKATPEATKP